MFIWAVIASIIARWQYNASKKKHTSLLEALNASERQLKDARERIEEHRSFDPRTWISQPPIADSSATDVTQSLLRKFEAAAPYVHQAASTLADEAAEEFVGGDEKKLHGALRYARLAALLAPEDKQTADNLAEIEAMHVANNAASGMYVPDLALLSSARDDKINDQLVYGYVGWLISSGRKKILEDIVLSEQLLRRARRIALNRIGPMDRLTLIARQLWAEAILELGLHGDALSELNGVLPDVRLVFGISDQRVLDILIVKQRALRELSRWDEAERLDGRIIRLSARIDRIRASTRAEREEANDDLNYAMELVLRRSTLGNEQVGPKNGG